MSSAPAKREGPPGGGGDAKRAMTAAAANSSNPLGMMLSSATQLGSELSKHAKARESAERAEHQRKSKVLRGREVVDALAAALADLRVAASGQATGGAVVEVEARIGMACEEHAEVGLSEAPSRSHPGLRGCGAVELGEGGHRFVAGVSTEFFAGATERIAALARDPASTLKEVETSCEHVFGSDDGDDRLVFAAGQSAAWRLERKRALHRVDYALPSAHYDLRLQCAMEETVGTSSSSQDNNINGGVLAPLRKWSWQRFKRRTSTKFPPWRVDATEVTVRSYPIDQLSNDQVALLAAQPEPTRTAPEGVPVFHDHKTTYELEIEIASPEAVKAWLGAADPAAEDRALAQRLGHLVSLVDPMERQNTRVIPATPAGPDLKAEALEVLGLSLAKTNRRFPGAMPVGMTRRCIPDLQRDEYFCAEKSDGERRLLLVTPKRECVFIDRELNVDVVRVSSSTSAALMPGAVLDGEVVRNLEIGRSVFLIFDVLHDGSSDLTGRNFARRFFGSLGSGCPLADALAVPCRGGESESTSAADNARLGAVLETVFADPRTVLLIPKRFVPTRLLGANVLGQIQKSGDAGGQVKWGSRVYRDGIARCHLSDGIVFVPNAPYISGTDPRLLKWKWRDGLTVDLEVRGAGKGGDLSLLACGDDGDTVDCSRHVVLGEHDAARLRADVKAATRGTSVVAEVGLDSASGMWEYHGVRPDKSSGNHFDVFVATLLLHAESPEEPELEYRLRFDSNSGARDDWADQLARAKKRICSIWVECYSKSRDRPYWWNSKTDEKLWCKPPDWP